MFRTVPLSIIRSILLYTQQTSMYKMYACIQFYSKNKFEKLVHIVNFIIRNDHDARSPERQIFTECFKPDLPHIIQTTVDLQFKYKKAEKLQIHSK